MKRAILIAVGVVWLGAVGIGTVGNPNFWSSPDRRGDDLMRHGKFADAAKTYADPLRAGIAQYRNGDFESAAKTFARVPGATGAFDQGNALLMHGKYDAAVSSYDRALGFQPGWKDAAENKAVALARKAKMEASGKDREKESADAYKPDDIAFDQKGDDRQGKPVELAQGAMSDEELRATWLRQVSTTPGDFLRAKFAYQVSRNEAGKEGAK